MRLRCHPSQFHLVVGGHLKPKVSGRLAIVTDSDTGFVGRVTLATFTKCRHMVTIAAIVWLFIDKPCFLTQYRNQQSSIAIHIVVFRFG